MPGTRSDLQLRQRPRPRLLTRQNEVTRPAAAHKQLPRMPLSGHTLQAQKCTLALPAACCVLAAACKAILQTLSDTPVFLLYSSWHFQQAQPYDLFHPLTRHPPGVSLSQHREVGTSPGGRLCDVEGVDCSSQPAPGPATREARQGKCNSRGTTNSGPMSRIIFDIPPHFQFFYEKHIPFYIMPGVGGGGKKPSSSSSSHPPPPRLSHIQ